MSKSTQKNLFELEDLPAKPMPWETAADADRLVAQVVFNRPLETVFDYLVPDELRGLIKPGQRVRAPFGKGNRSTVGFCVALGSSPKTSRKLKSIDSVLDRQPLLSAKMLELTQWIADRYLCAWGQVLESVVPAGVKRGAGTRIVNGYVAAAEARHDTYLFKPKMQSL